MNVKRGLEKEWEEAKAKNIDPYGHAVVVYTENLGGILDTGIPEKNFKKATIDADVNTNGGITGFMYRCAVQWIARFHPRGEEFRRWHNLTMQIGNEGQEANQRAGAVLNPALLRADI